MRAAAPSPLTVVGVTVVALLGGCQKHEAPVRVGEVPDEPALASSSAGEPAVAVRPELPARGVAGIVTDLDGAALARARVCAWTKRPPVEVVRDEMLTPICAGVDPRGGYVLELGAGVWRLVASAPEREPELRSVVLRESSANAVVDHRLARGGRLFRKRVVDNLGQPVAGAVITGNLGVSVPDRGFVQGTSAADGSVELWGTHVTALLWARAPGFIHDFFVRDGDAIVLIPESGVRGRVVDADGAPVAGARVAIRDWYTLYGDREDAVRTAADGSFEIAGARPGARSIVALTDRARGHAAVELGYAKFVSDVVIRLEPWPRLHLRVVEPGVGPVAMCGVSLAVARGDDDLGDRFWTDEEGRIDVPLRPERYRLVDLDCRGKVGAPPFLDVIDLRREDATVELQVDAGQTLRGRVRTPAGDPIAHEELWLRPPSRSEGRDPIFDTLDPDRIRTDAEGRFELGGLAPGTYTLGGIAWMSFPRMPTLQVTDAPVTEVEVTVPPSGRVEVQSSRRRWDQMARVRACAPIDSRWGDNERSDGDGRAVFEHVPIGEVIVSIGDSPYCSSADALRLKIADGDRHRVELAAKDPETETETITVHVEGPGREPVHGALIQVNGGHDSIVGSNWSWLDGAFAVTDADGVAQIELGTRLRLQSVEAIAPGLAARLAPEIPEFDEGDEGDEGEEGDEEAAGYEDEDLEGSEFHLRLEPAAPPAASDADADEDQ